jgi:hypothetical protein
VSANATVMNGRVLWTRNTFKACKTWGAQIQADGGGAQQMYFYKNTFEGTTGVDGLYPNVGDGFRFNSNGSIQNITLDSNTIKNNALCGLTCGDGSPVDNDKLSVINNVITGNKKSAFTGDYGSFPGTSFQGSDLRWAGNTVTGNGSNTQPSSKGTFFPGKTPAVSIVGPKKVAVGQNAAFSLNYQGVDLLGNVLWDFGDGLPCTTASGSITYTQPGTYVVGLVVWDSSGRAAHDELSMFVTAAEPASARLSAAAIVGLSAGVWVKRKLAKCNQQANSVRPECIRY